MPTSTIEFTFKNQALWKLKVLQWVVKVLNALSLGKPKNATDITIEVEIKILTVLNPQQ